VFGEGRLVGVEVGHEHFDQIIFQKAVGTGKALLEPQHVRARILEPTLEVWPFAQGQSIQLCASSGATIETW